MQNQVSSRPRIISLIIVSLATIFNLLAALFVGFVLFFAYAVADPANDNINFETFYSQKIHDLWMIGLVTLVFIIIFFVSYVLWLLGKRFSDISLSSITLLHVLGIIVFRHTLFPVLVIGSLSLDFVIMVVIFLEKKYPRKSVLLAEQESF